MNRTKHNSIQASEPTKRQKLTKTSSLNENQFNMLNTGKKYEDSYVSRNFNVLMIVLFALTWIENLEITEAFLPAPLQLSSSSFVSQREQNILQVKVPPLSFQTFRKQQTQLFSVENSIQKRTNDENVNKTRRSNNNRNQNNRRNNNSNNNRFKNNNRNYKNNQNFKSKENPFYKAKNLNSKIISCNLPSEVLSTFVESGAARGTGGNDEMNSVNFSTSLHRIAKTCTMFRQYKKHNENDDGPPVPTQKELRTSTLTDPRFAILLCAVSEAFVQKKHIWSSRELSNISWALAKINFVPDFESTPLSSFKNIEEEDIENSNAIEDADQALLNESKKLREYVMLAGKYKRTANQEDYAEFTKKWISQMRLLAAVLLDVIGLHVQYKLLQDFKSQELANIIWALGTAGRGDVSLFNALVKRLLENNTAKQKSPDNTLAKPQELSNSIWSFATTGLRCEGQVELVHYIAKTFSGHDTNPNYIEEFKPQELSNTAWGVATLISKRSESNYYSPDGNVIDAESLSIIESKEEESAFQIIREISGEVLRRIDAFKPQEVSNTLWAMATIGFADPESPHTILPDDTILLKEVFQKTAVDALPRLRRFSPQELNCLGWAYARLNAERTPEIDSLFAGIEEEVKNRIRFFSPQDVGTTLWSFATMGYDDLIDVYKVATSRVTIRDAHRFKPQELSNSVWALATVGIFPSNVHVFDSTMFPNSKKMLMDAVMGEKDAITECFAAAAMEVMKRPSAFKEQELKDVLWSFSKSGIRHPELFKSVAHHVLADASNDNQGIVSARLSDFSPQGIGNFVWSYARQAQLSNEPSSSDDWKGQQQNNSNSSGRLAIYETMCLDLGESLVNRLFASVADSSLNEKGKLDLFKPQDLSNTVWAFATLGLLHREFFGAVAEQVQQSVAYHTGTKQSRKGQVVRESFKPQEVANLIWAFATLNCHPKLSLLHTFSPYIMQTCASGKGDGKGQFKYDEVSISKKFNRQELANIAWSCAVLEQYPPDLIPLLFTGLIGTGEDDENIDRMTKLYNDNGLQKKAIMSLLYVQMALDLEAPQLNMRLPDKLLEMWSDQDDSIFAIDGGNGENDLMLLSTSKLQTSVSKVFDKIGFSHVQEHVLGSDTLREHGITLTSSPLNFLSIDIANIESRIGIEVDGPSHFINILDEYTEDSKGSKMQDLKSGKMWLFEWDGDRQVNGPTGLKHRLLTHLGWRIIHIPFWEWNTLDSEESQNEYCRKLLEPDD